MTKRIAIVAAAVLLAGSALLVYAHGDRMGHGMGWHRGGMLGRIARALDLTESQKAEVRKLWEAERPTVQPLLQQMAAGRKEMLAATANGKFDEAQVRGIAQRNSQVMAQLAVERERLINKVYNQVLNPEQRQKVDQFRQKRVSHMDEWLQRMADGSLD